MEAGLARKVVLSTGSHSKDNGGGVAVSRLGRWLSPESGPCKPLKA